MATNREAPSQAKRGFFEEHLCPWWFCYSFDNPLRWPLQNPREILGGLVSDSMTCMDIGCGMGYFTIDMARLAGETGRVIAVDLQDKMLAGVRRRAKRAGLSDRIKTHRCETDSLGVNTPVDFALMFWMAHEVSDKDRLFGEVASVMKPGSRLLLAEPKWHVSLDSWNEMTAIAETAGLRQIEERSIRLSRAIVLQRHNT